MADCERTVTLVQTEIPRAWLLPEPDSGERLQEHINHATLMLASDMLKGLTQVRARTASKILNALYEEHSNDFDADSPLGIFTSEEATVPNFFEECFFSNRNDNAPQAVCALISVMDFPTETEDTDRFGDPRGYYYVIVYWDIEYGLWRLPNERWGIVRPADGEPISDPGAPATIPAFIHQGVFGKPNIEDVLAAYLQ